MKALRIKIEKKTIHAILIAALLIVTFILPQTVSAETAVAKVDGKDYTSYEEAWDAVKEGGTIEMLTDWKTKGKLTVPKNVIITVVMNKYRVDRNLAGNDKKSGNGCVFYVKESGTLCLYEGKVTGGSSTGGGGGIHMEKNSKVELYNVTVTGNRANEDTLGRNGQGGGVMMQGEKAHLYLKDSHIDENKAEDGGGGIYIAANNCKVELDGISTINENTISDSEGSGILISGKKARIIGTADENGDPTSCIDNNGSVNYNGGGIYVDEENAHIKNVNIRKNFAEEGAGIYVNDEGCKLYNCRITQNSCSVDDGGGGGVFVSSLRDIDISGEMVIKNNNKGDKENNLLLNQALPLLGEAHITGHPWGEEDSIGITNGVTPLGFVTKGNAERVFTDKGGDYDPRVFFSDKSEYGIYWNYYPEKEIGDKHLRVVSAKKLAKEEEENGEVVLPVIAKLNGEEFYKPQSVIETAANHGGEIEMLCDWKTIEPLKIPEGTEVSIKMNGYKIDRGLEDKIVKVDGGTVIDVEKEAVLTLIGGTVTGGASKGGAGGIRIKEAARTNLIDTTVSKNTAVINSQLKPHGNGGGVILDGKNAYLYLKNSHITENQAARKGGGVYISDKSNCTVELVDGSTISKNKALNSDGGGIYINGKDAQIIGSLDESGIPTGAISENMSSDDGGGIYAEGDAAVIKDIKVSSNMAGRTSPIISFFDKGEGGGVFTSGQICEFNGAFITGNEAGAEGGGVYVSKWVDVLLYNNLIIKDNKVKNKASNLYLNADEAMQKSNIWGQPTSEPGSIGISRPLPRYIGKNFNTLSAEAGKYDASVYFSDDPKYTIFFEAEKEGNTGEGFIKINDYSKVPISEHVAVVNEKQYDSYEEAWEEAAKDGGTVEIFADWYIDSTLIVPEGKEMTLKLNGHKIDRNLAAFKDSEGDGTVLSAGKNSTINVYDGTLTGGCSDEYSSGIHIKERARVNLYNVNVTENRSEESGYSDGNGGVMLDGEGAYLYMKDSHITNNYAEMKGGGLYISNHKYCTVELDGNSTISNNEARDSHGGGVFINGQHATIIGHLDENGQPTSKISENTTDNDGAGIYVNSEHFLIKNVEISGNIADIDGGGIYADNEDGTIEGCVIKNNKTKSGASREGGGVYVDNGGWTLKDCTVTGNNADDKGGGVFVTFSVDVAVEGNMIIKDNTADGKSDDLCLNVSGNTKAYIKDPAKITSGPASVGIKSGKATDKRRLSADSGVFDASKFFSNDEKYVVAWDYDKTTQKGDKLLKLREKSKVKSELTEEVAPTEPTEPTEQLEPTEQAEPTEPTEVTKSEEMPEEMQQESTSENEDSDNETLPGMMLGSGSIYAMIAVVIAVAAGGFVVIRRRRI